MDKANELLKKQLRLQRMGLLFLAIILAAVAITCAIVVRNVTRIEQTVIKIDGIVDDLAVASDALGEVDWDTITTELASVSQELSSVDWVSLSTDISNTALEAQKSLRTASEAVDKLDLATLNKAIAELQAVVAPLANLVDRFH